MIIEAREQPGKGYKGFEGLEKHFRVSDKGQSRSCRIYSHKGGKISYDTNSMAIITFHISVFKAGVREVKYNIPKAIGNRRGSYSLLPSQVQQDKSY